MIYLADNLRKNEITKRQIAELVYACSVCKKVYKKPGMCVTCNVLLKSKGG